ncbi:MAG: UDP-3-O-acyl-N-acetylglucosamine deacetylase [Neomegalonema sp.]|nr:UDP-3-O-acyl-N-acetylglucosamine deacetylase [Neomegalonema sp.]
MQTTIKAEMRFEGVGVHRGAVARAIVKPAAVGTGIVFIRTDLIAAGSHDRAQASIPARYDHVVDTRMCTVIGNAHGALVSTIEHLMAALAAFGIDNALVEIDGPEIPIMDGSSAPFMAALRETGAQALAAPRRALRILKPVAFQDGNKRAELRPSRRFEISFEIDFAEKIIGRQRRFLAVDTESFTRELSRARTFCRRVEIEALRAAGLAKGGSLDNAIVVDGDSVLNPGGLHFEDEFVRHKILDAVGDLALAGGPIIGRYEGLRAGHGITNQLLRALFADPTAWRWVELPAIDEMERQKVAA